ncbi:Short wavelength sensitive B opsin 3 [Ladona fulva]|uniref:RhSWc3 protein n=1 Tax=Ladona fulva TaxID=123851 RepID=A0A0C9LI86_LADFU|nr:Short wavelength sensitive B opsin 3 [Ladona fulva]FAA01187.1 TPA: opsin, short-wavelength sensitive type [Ladona fulva]
MYTNISYGPSVHLLRNGIIQAQIAEVGDELLGSKIYEDYLDNVHPHWRQFKAPAAYQHFLLGIVYAFIFFMGTLGNGLVLITFFTTKGLRTPSNMFVANLATFDTIMMFHLPFFCMNSVVEGQLFGKIGCELYACAGAISGMGASMTNAMIAFDRYRTIAFPLDGRLGMKAALGLVAFTWLWAMPFSLLPFFEIWSKFSPEGYLTTCSFDYLEEGKSTQLFTIVIFVWAYIIPLLLIALFYSRIISHVREHEKMLKEQAKRMNVKSLSQGSGDEKSAEIKIAKVAITIVLMFICGWTPYALVAIIGCFGDRSIMTPTFCMFPAIACKTVACIDPWIYAINHPRFRAEISKKVPWLFSEKPKKAAPADNKSEVSEAKAENA